MTPSGASLVRPTFATRIALELIAFIVVASAAFLIVRYPSLPWLLPVHFKSNGVPNGWQYKTMARVLLPVFVQLVIALTLGIVSVLLLSRPHGRHEADAPDVKAAAAAAEAVAFIALIWVAFQAYAAVALTTMWRNEHEGLGLFYTYFELTGVVLTGIVWLRAHALLGRPAPRPYVEAHWRRHLYNNPDDPALFVPTRDGARWTLNFGRPIAAILLGVVVLAGIISPMIILGLALRS